MNITEAAPPIPAAVTGPFVTPVLALARSENYGQALLAWRTAEHSPIQAKSALAEQA